MSRINSLLCCARKLCVKSRKHLNYFKFSRRILTWERPIAKKFRMIPCSREFFPCYGAASPGKPCPQQVEQRARRLDLAALWRVRAGFRIPGVDVEMRPGFGAVGEAPQEQRRRHRPRKGAAGSVVEVGEGALQHRIVGPPERQAPDWIAHADGMTRDVLC